MAWRLAKSLEQLRRQINAAYPNRDKRSDGTIADAAHSKRVSDHNPNSAGVVTAIDITNDPANGVVGFNLAGTFTRDARSKYVIFNGLIWKARTGKWEKYTGANKHKQHIHLSVKAESYDDETPWDIGPATTPKYGDVVEFVKAFQRKHGLVADGIPGKKTYAKLDEVK